MYESAYKTDETVYKMQETVHKTYKSLYKMYEHLSIVASGIETELFFAFLLLFRSWVNVLG